MNNVLLTGCLAHTPDLRESEGLTVAQLVLRNRTEYRDRQGLCRDQDAGFDITAYGDVARSCQTLKTGNRIAVQGWLRSSEVEQDGRHFQRFDVVATSIELILLREFADETLLETTEQRHQPVSGSEG
jgi:single-stranded DNA-binding protein